MLLSRAKHKFCGFSVQAREHARYYLYIGSLECTSDKQELVSFFSLVVRFIRERGEQGAFFGNPMLLSSMCLFPLPFTQTGLWCFILAKLHSSPTAVRLFLFSRFVCRLWCSLLPLLDVLKSHDLWTNYYCHTMLPDIIMLPLILHRRNN